MASTPFDPNEPAWKYNKHLQGPPAYYNKLYDPYECEGDFFCTDKIQCEPSTAFPMCKIDMIPKKEPEVVPEPEIEYDDDPYKEVREFGPAPVVTITYLIDCVPPYKKTVEHVGQNGTILCMKDLMSRLTIIQDHDVRQHWKDEKHSVLYERLQCSGPRTVDKDALHYLNFFWIKEDLLVDWEELMAEQFSQVLANEPDTLHYSFYRYIDDPCHFAIYEIFKNKEAKEHHYTQPFAIELEEWLRTSQQINHSVDEGYYLIVDGLIPPPYDFFFSDTKKKQGPPQFPKETRRPEDIDWPLEWLQDVYTEEEIEEQQRQLIRDTRPFNDMPFFYDYPSSPFPSA